MAAVQQALAARPAGFAIAAVQMVNAVNEPDRWLRLELGPGTPSTTPIRGLRASDRNCARFRHADPLRVAGRSAGGLRHRGGDQVLGRRRILSFAIGGPSLW